MISTVIYSYRQGQFESVKTIPWTLMLCDIRRHVTDRYSFSIIVDKTKLGLESTRIAGVPPITGPGRRILCKHANQRSRLVLRFFEICPTGFFANVSDRTIWRYRHPRIINYLRNCFDQNSSVRGLVRIDTNRNTSVAPDS